MLTWFFLILYFAALYLAPPIFLIMFLIHLIRYIKGKLQYKKAPDRFLEAEIKQHKQRLLVYGIIAPILWVISIGLMIIAASHITFM